MDQRRKRSRSVRVPEGTQSRPRNSRFVTKKEMSGGAFRPGSNPPQVTYIPWNNVTLVISHNTDLSLKVNDILKHLKSQLDPTGRGFNTETSGDKRFVVQMRIHSIAAWNLTGRVISLSVEDFSDTNSASSGRDQLVGLVDTGTSTHTPSVGYKIPSNLSQHVIRTDDVTGSMFLLTVTAPAGSQLVTYLKISYRFDGPAKHPEIMSPLAEIETTIKDAVAGYNKRSTIDILVDGIAYTAQIAAVTGLGTSLSHKKGPIAFSTTFDKTGPDNSEVIMVHENSGVRELAGIAESLDCISLSDSASIGDDPLEERPPTT